MRGQSPQRLSAHYRLECDYGTAFTAIYKDGDAFFLCDAHAASFNPLDAGTIAGVRVIEPPSPETKQTKIDLPVQVFETAAANAEIPARPVSSADIPSDDAPLATVDEPNQNPQPTAAGDYHSDQPAPEIQSPDNTECPALLEAIEGSEPAVAASDASPEPAAIPGVETVRRETVRSSTKGIVRDLTFGDCAKALVDEAIWNFEPGNFEAYQTALQQGKSEMDAAEAAGGQLAIVHRKIKDYKLKTETILSESKAMIDVRDALNRTLERAMVEMIDDTALNEAEKDAAIDHLGNFQQWMSDELGRELSPLRAHRLASSIGDRANWGIGSCAVEALKPAYRVVYKSLRNAVLLAVPSVHSTEERLANLCAAKSDLESEFRRKLQSVATASQ